MVISIEMDFARRQNLNLIELRAKRKVPLNAAQSKGDCVGREYIAPTRNEERQIHVQAVSLR